MDSSTPAFGVLLRRHRLAAGLTQEELAERSNVSARAISALERGVNRAPQRGTFQALAAALGIGARELDELRAATRAPLLASDTMSPPSPQGPVKGIEMPSGAAEPPAVGAPADPPGERSGLTPLQQEFVSLLASITEGDFSRKILNLDESGADGEAIRAINAEKRRLGALLTTLITEITRIARELGTDGTFGGQAQVPGASGVWKHLVDSVNAMSYGLTHQVRDCAHVVEALSRGDATKRVTAEARGETLRLEQAINATVDRLRAVQ